MFGDTRDPPNELMANREDTLNQITASTVEAAYHGGGGFILRARDDTFWGDTYEALDDHGFRITKHLGGDMYVEKVITTERDLERRADAEKERTLARRHR